MAIANAFQNSLQQLGEWLKTPEGRALQSDPTFLTTGQGRLMVAGEPAPTPYLRPGNAAQPSPVWSGSAPSPMPVQMPSRGTTGSWQDAAPPVDIGYGPGVRSPSTQPAAQTYISPTNEAAMAGPIQNPAGYISPTNQAALAAPPAVQAPAAQAPATQPATVQAPAGPAPATNPTAPPGYISPTNQAAMAAANKVSTTVDSPTHKVTHTVQAKPPKQAGSGGSSQASTGAGAGATAAGTAPAGPAPATKPWTYGAPPAQAPAAPPAQGQGNNVNLQVPAHPGLLQRIGQTISHFFGGTLGQHEQPAQPQQPYTYGAPPQSNALSGIHSALASGRQHVATHGGSAPASAAAPNLALGPLGGTDIEQAPTGDVYRADITNPVAYRTAIKPPAGATQTLMEPKTGKRYWGDKDGNIIAPI